MNHFNHTAVVHASCEKLYRIITDVENYPKIINQCREAKITSREPLADGSEKVIAALKLKVGPFNRSFVTSNIHNPCTKVVVNLHSGAMQKLTGEWRLQQLEADVSKIECDFHFSLGNSAMDAIASRFLSGYLKQSIERYIAHAEQQC